ncbi:MAG: hypothetical protein AAF908_02020 [Pseudomonadota bacterium]
MTTHDHRALDGEHAEACDPCHEPDRAPEQSAEAWVSRRRRHRGILPARLPQTVRW